ncbi:DNA primase/polymerase, bifunctional, N-terminal [uncultured Caudovirales phage]|uniref:DNA primase/polymerase, bifunctional, N-terminal n=3 Tax=uncultured Caudovirales phage TaxID=2100421 RepID=A0A6J5RKJ6_9CAUD|nr:DNA primase/polymerase, bifunctional, N-terminal [uncultured Caudovirales phage]CAB4176740.1 DNA primase/polymerase, bifunctional, N-terminal [uncultured Caudovirales phage]CAB4197933.1 DNA primase/polymerase, bifunctional, N-terminal [uncultured Caudovirales phage]CAB4210571.1 DNA primase/polymerase, bifunctional, N-terminal [uncultured Caudovirales phage]CAB5227589.1 DNA primase/polymerase, bifunctional, N-terminal [uncultured Caudovirales phage]
MSIGALQGTYDRGWKLVRLYGVREPAVCTCWRGKDCGTPGKHPAGGAEWQLRATSDEDEIASWFDTKTPVNVGILLGPLSGVIDIELDGEDSVKAWSDLGLGEVYTPTYVAGRGPHRLFRWDESLPPVQVKKLRGIEFRFGNGGRASQSVIPPSTHHTGKVYQWVSGLSPADVELAPVPEKLLTLLWNDDGSNIQPGSGKRPARLILQEPVHQAADGPGRNNELYRFAVREAFRCGPLLDSPVEQQDLLTKIRAVNATQCRPPLGDEEVKEVFRSAVGFARKSHSGNYDPVSAMQAANIMRADREAPGASDSPENEAEEAGEGSGDGDEGGSKRRKGRKPKKAGEPKKTCDVFTDTGLAFLPIHPDSDPEWGPGEWHLTIVHSDPLEYRLHVPAWKKHTVNNTGNVSLTVDQYRSATKVAATVLAATGRVMLDAEPKKWFGIWDGGQKVQDFVSSQPKTRATKGVKAKLLDNAVEEWPGASSQRYVALAGYVYDRLCQASQPGDDDIPDPTGRAAWRQDGTLWFSWARVWEDIERQHRVMEGERLALKRRLLGRLEMPDFVHGRFRHIGDTRRTYVVWTKVEFSVLEQIATEEVEQPAPFGGEAGGGADSF